MANLGKMLTSYKPRKGVAVPKTGVIKTNKVKGSPREGRQYIDVTDASGITVHRYGTEGDDVAWAKGKPRVTGQSAQGPLTAATTTTLPEKTPAAPKAPAAPKKPGKGLSGQLTNKMKGSVRYGQKFTKTTRGGLAGHLYSDGTFVKMGKAKK